MKGSLDALILPVLGFSVSLQPNYDSDLGAPDTVFFKGLAECLKLHAATITFSADEAVGEGTCYIHNTRR